MYMRLSHRQADLLDTLDLNADPYFINIILAPDHNSSGPGLTVAIIMESLVFLDNNVAQDILEKVFSRSGMPFQQKNSEKTYTYYAMGQSKSEGIDLFNVFEKGLDKYTLVDPHYDSFDREPAILSKTYKVLRSITTKDWAKKDWVKRTPTRKADLLDLINKPKPTHLGLVEFRFVPSRDENQLYEVNRSFDSAETNQDFDEALAKAQFTQRRFDSANIRWCYSWPQQSTTNAYKIHRVMTSLQGFLKENGIDTQCSIPNNIPHAIVFKMVFN